MQIPETFFSKIVQHSPESTIKVLTALAALQRLSLNDTIQITNSDIVIHGNQVGLSYKHVYTGRDLLYGLLLGNGNDAALALAQNTVENKKS